MTANWLYCVQLGHNQLCYNTPEMVEAAEPDVVLIKARCEYAVRKDTQLSLSIQVVVGVQRYSTSWACSDCSAARWEKAIKNASHCRTWFGHAAINCSRMGNQAIH